jgi:hypothetical protein
VAILIGVRKSNKRKRRRIRREGDKGCTRNGVDGLEDRTLIFMIRGLIINYHGIRE